MKLLNRAIKIPVASVLECPIDGITPENYKGKFYEDLQNSLKLASRLANLAVTECLSRDNLAGVNKCPLAKDLDAAGVKSIYNTVADMVPELEYRSIASPVVREVVAKYRRERWEYRSGRRSAPTYRNMSYPLAHNSSRKLLTFEFSDDGDLIVRMRLQSGWWKVRMAGGSNHRRQIQGLQTAKSVGDSKIWINKKNKAILGFAVKVSPKTNRAASGVMEIKSMRDSLLTAMLPQDETPHIVTGDKYKKLVRERNRKQERLRCDKKSGTPRRRLKNTSAKVSEKFKNRTDSFLHETTAQLVTYAIRRKVAKVRLDLTVRSWMPDFQWFELERQLRYKCEDNGLEFEVATPIEQLESSGDITKPQVYFKYAPSTQRVKIGFTANGKSRHGGETDSSENLIILAVINCKVAEMRKLETQYKSQFAKYNVGDLAPGVEYFEGEPVIDWLQEVGLFGNTGNLSQIAQYIDVSKDTHCPPTSEASVTAPTLKSESKVVAKPDLTTVESCTYGCNPATAIREIGC